MTDIPKWTIREAGADDAPALALIGAATFLETFAGILDGDAIVGHCAAQHCEVAYRAALANGARAWLAEAQPGGAPVGFVLVGKPDLAAARDGDIELKRIYSLSRFHGTGLGAALMTQALEAARGHRRLLLGVYAQNDRALAFYRKQGFADLGTRRFNVGGKLYDDLVLARPLAA
ncbi:GNAT family N-acetyltransferase [Sphingopyxis macrogoltabida]|uniref:GCN5 family acetyltransferase n=1 Tax=Sphingopyxis macrogoltabida TaxID=33050 RepID=A0AAC8Z2F1_SPHMC|nr:N-acetyltransferase [Sphingopyxis macrogoltabida]ALJ14347.1 GCN5 family acetyltransferase [Sphingopyxis macrogoltabida]AMU90614.1 GCN5 family acetyltransferase [Sphingopyxis macrogoltabida]